MRTDRLEEFIKTNRAEFDQPGPSPEVWQKIKANSQKSKRLMDKSFAVQNCSGCCNCNCYCSITC